VVPALLVLVLAQAVLDRESGVRQWLHLHRELADSEQRIARLRIEVEELRREAEQLEAGGFTAERAVREELGLVRPGQTLVLLRPAGSQVLEFLDENSVSGDPGRP
jgi:cell division protein FtsB